VKITDRGPHVRGRIVDLSRAAANRIDMVEAGTVPVKLKVIRRSKSAGR
jgi:rare lipoprotein A